MEMLGIATALLIQIRPQQKALSLQKHNMVSNRGNHEKHKERNY